MQDEPWTIDLLRRMRRAEFNARVKRGDLPPVDLAAQLMAERLGLAVERSL